VQAALWRWELEVVCLVERCWAQLWRMRVTAAAMGAMVEETTAATAAEILAVVMVEVSAVTVEAILEEVIWEVGTWAEGTKPSCDASVYDQIRDTCGTWLD
jgi:hypothetical protein